MAISYNRLGSNGRLGNQMFQYSGLRGIAAHHGYDWVVPPPVNYGDSNYGLFECFKMNSANPQNFGYNQNCENLATGIFEFSQEFFDNCPDNINIHDYFQSERWFKHIEDDIRNDFTFKNEIMAPCLDIINDYEDPIFLHVRRGDYLSHPESHPACTMEYYNAALEHFPKDTPVFVFSDDLEWCREQFTDDRFLISTENPLYSHTADTINGRVQTYVPYYDMCLMSLCSHAIMANSSMSWWGAWLIPDKNKKVIAPKAWFGSKFADRYMGDLYPEGWIVL